MRRIALSIALAASLLAACGDDADHRAASASSGELAAKRPPLAPYREIVVTDPARVTGVVELEGEIPRDSVARFSAEVAQSCGATMTQRTLELRGTRVANVVVWLEGLRAGKAIPLARRYTVTISGCALAPRSQAALVGGTLNVVNEDPITQETTVRREGVVAPLATMRFGFDGQVVPLDRVLSESGVLEIASTVQPGAHAWVHAFDQPYFAMTTDDGAFAIDSVPPGSYELVAWHERLGEIRQRITVTGAGETRVTLSARAH